MLFWSGVLFDMFEDNAVGWLVWQFIDIVNGILDRDVIISSVPRLQSAIVRFLCLAEVVFPVSFFTYMPHSLLHIAEPFMMLYGSLLNICNLSNERMLGSLKRKINSRSAPEINLMNVYSMRLLSNELALALDSINDSLKNAIFSPPKNKFFLVGRRGFLQFFEDYASEEYLEGTEIADLRSFKLDTHSHSLIDNDANRVSIQVFERALFGFGLLTSWRHQNRYASTLKYCGNRAFAKRSEDDIGAEEKARVDDDHPLHRFWFFDVEYFARHGNDVLARIKCFGTSSHHNFHSGLDVIEMSKIRVRDKWIYLDDVSGRVISHSPRGKDNVIRLVKPQNKSESNLFC